MYTITEDLLGKNVKKLEIPFEQNIKNPHLYSENRLEKLKNSMHIYWKSFKTIKKAHLYSEDSFV